MRQSVFLLILWAAMVSISAAQDSPILATVNGQPISENVVHRFLDRTFEHLPKLSKRSDRSKDIVRVGVEHCVKREVILQYLSSGKFNAVEREIDNRVDELALQLEATGKNIETFLTESKLSEAELRREIQWQITWRKYVSAFVTIEHLQKRFDEKRKYFDGTTLHVAQILWKQNDDATLLKAEQLRQQLSEGLVQWSDAVTEYSESASAKNGGDLGWIGYDGPMPRGFTQVAFELEAGQLSKPFTSPFGTHLVRCIEVKSGTKTFEDVASELRDLEANRLFELVASRHRSESKIELKDTLSPASRGSTSE